MIDKGMHLSEDQILLSLVDENDLSQEVRSHLLACTACQEKKTALISELEHLGQMAKDLAPLPRQKPLPLVRESRHFSFRLRVLAAGFAVVLIIACLLSLVFFTDSSKQMTARLSTEMETDLYLVDEILEESTLPEYYLDIAVTSYSYFDDEFLEFVVPLEEQLDSV